MRRKLVLWGSNEKDEKMLVALELLEKENVVDIYTFPESIATEQFYKDMTDLWRDDKEVEFPSGYKKIVQKLSVSESLLPDEIRVERPELISRAQAEWHFVVLSSKLYELYRSEIEEIKEKVDGITEYDNMLWDEMKEFWSKVQAQVNEKNLFREHGAALREKSNAIFDKLKLMRKELDKKFEQESKGIVANIVAQLSEVEDKIEKGLGLHPLFDELKKIQSSLHGFKFTRGDRDDLWSKIDSAFKKLKEKRGSSQNVEHSNNNLARVEARLKGLEGAIHKMQKSIDFDQNELDFQSKKVADSDGQLESQLRVAKIRMIEERVNSKKEKLDDMHKTKAELDARIIREQKRADKVEKQEKIEEAKASVKQKIASGISENAKELEGMSDKLEKAASELAANAKPKAKSMIAKLTDSVGDLIEDAVDSVKAIAEAVEDKYEEVKDRAEDMIDDIKDAVEDKYDDVKDKAEDLKDMAEDKYEDVKDKLEELKDKAEDKYDDAKDKAIELKDSIADKFDDLKDKAEDKYEAAKDKLADVKDSVADKIEDMKDKSEDIIEDVKDEVVALEDKAEDKIDDLQDKAEDKIDEIKS